MTSMNVVPAELSQRAREIVQPLPQWPEVAPKALCELDAAKNGAIALQEGADVILDALGQGQRRWQALAQAVMGAANAYEGVDESAASSLDFDNPGSAIEVKEPGVAGSLTFNKLVPASSRNYTRMKETVYHSQAKKRLDYGLTNRKFGLSFDEDFIDRFFETQTARYITGGELDSKFLDVKTVAQLLESGNRNSLDLFRYEWSEYEKKLRSITTRFRGFNDWEGEAATKVEKYFQRHAEMIRNLEGLCRALSQNAQTVTDAYTTACANHPKLKDIDAIYRRLDSSAKASAAEYDKAMAELEKMQQTSQDVLTAYRKSVNNLAPLDKPAVPDRVDGDLFLTTEQISERNRKKQQEQLKRDTAALIDDMTEGPGTMTQPDAAALANSAGMGATRPPSLPSPQKLLSAVNQAATLAKGMGHKPAPGGAGTGLPPLDPHAPKVSPAAAMPGRGGGGVPSLGGGLGKAPLQPPSLPGGWPGGSPGTAAASFTPGVAGAGSHGGAAGAGGGMGGAPMGGMGAKAQDSAGKSKRVGDDDSALYTEQRAWTEGIIGITPRKLGPTSKEG
ncbi:hypothetical protein AAHS21_15820 [Mycobacterium sp. 050272]|uniref:PPE domain-containing protein n=1 Tax=Mycobacterium sp. 050272 TaxID=3142488 RepID=UPI00318DFA64